MALKEGITYNLGAGGIQRLESIIGGTPPTASYFTYYNTSAIVETIITKKLIQSITAGEGYYDIIPNTTETTKFNTDKQITSFKNPDVIPTEYWEATYDSNNNMTSFIDHITKEHWTATYNPDSLRTSYIEYFPDGTKTTELWKYDGNGNNTFHQGIQGDITTSKFDKNSNRIETTNNSNPEKPITEWRKFDDKNREVYYESSEGDKVWTVYDEYGRSTATQQYNTNIIGAEEVVCADDLC